MSTAGHDHHDHGHRHGGVDAIFSSERGLWALKWSLAGLGLTALVADEEHARVDGLTSLAVVAGAAGMALGAPIADPIVDCSSAS